MTTIMPDRAVKQAIEWISQQLNEQQGASLSSLIFTAISKFDLNPKDSEFLINFYKKD